MSRFNSIQPQAHHAGSQWLSACVFGLLAASSALSRPAYAADFSQGVDTSGTPAKIFFKSNVSTTWVDVHYRVDGGAQRNFRMTNVPVRGRYEQPLDANARGALSYSFTYNNGGPAFDTPAFTVNVGGSNPPPPDSPPPALPPTTPAPTGIVCFYADIEYRGASICSDSTTQWIGTVWNDRVSSVRIRAGYELELFNDINFGGRALKLSGDTANLVSVNFNDLASSYRITQPGNGGGGGGQLPTSDTPDLGASVTIFDTSVPTATVQSKIDEAFNSQLRSATAQFGEQRHVFLFKPGNYGQIFANLGFYTTIAGLGRNPDDVSLQGDINVDSGWNRGDETNATQNFWRSAENLAITPSGGTDRWAVSQAAPMRRLHIRGNLTMGPSNQDYGRGYSSGGYIADSRIDGGVGSGSQQQWYMRDTSIGGWEGGVWNMVFSGVQGAPSQGFPDINKNTVLATTPVSAGKPYLYIDGSGRYSVFVPAIRRNASGPAWPNAPGTSIPMSRFYVAHPGDSATRLNTALAQGLNLYFSPGVYRLDRTLEVTRADTVVTGIGYPTLIPVGGVTAMHVADVDGVRISSLLFDAGTVNSPSLLTLGMAGQHGSHANDPAMVQDVYFRIGGAVAGKATNSLVVHSDNTVIDHIWAWRADHGNSPTGWTINTAETGVIVNGDDVLATGLFVEHYQKYNVLWNGNRGSTIFFQNEMPYDPPSQSAWRTGALGYAAYKVADGVTQHEAWGLGSYCFFNVDPSIRADRGFEVPNTPGVRLHSVLTVSLGGVGEINHVVNDTGAVAEGVKTIPVSLKNYP